MGRSARWRLLAVICGLWPLAPSRAASPASSAEDEEREPEPCRELRAGAKDSKIRGALKKHEPVLLPLSAVMGEVAKGKHWDLFRDKDCFNLAVSSDGTFFGPVPDQASPLGIRRVAPALLECVPWPILRELMEWLARQVRQPGASDKGMLPRRLQNAKFPNYNDVLGDGAVPLASALLAPGRGLYVDGQASSALDAALSGRLLANLTERLTRAMNQKPAVASLWLSGGRLVEKLHYDSSDSWLCQFAGRQDLTFVAHSDLDKLYPVNFAEPGAAVDFQQILRADGQFVEEPVPDEYRDPAGHLAAVDVDDPDYASFPKFVNATPVTCSLSAGNCIWVPSFWWRRALPVAEAGPSLAISLLFESRKPAGKKTPDGKKEGFDRTAALFGLESLSRVTDSTLRALARHTEL